MKVFNINPAVTSPVFKGLNTKNNNGQNNTEKPHYPHVSGSKINTALKASLVVPLLVGGLSACDRIEEDWGGEINPPTTEKYNFIHRFPEITVNGVTFSEQTVNINKQLDPDGPVNKAFNNVLNTLDVPKKSEGEFPVNMFWAKGDSVFHMIMDGALTDDDKYVYHLSKVNRKEGTVKNLVVNLTNDGENLKISTDDYLNTKDYNVVCSGDSVTVYKNNENVSEKAAVYKKELIPQPNGKDKYTVEETVFGADTTRVNLDNFVIWSVNNE